MNISVDFLSVEKYIKKTLLETNKLIDESLSIESVNEHNLRFKPLIDAKRDEMTVIFNLIKNNSNCFTLDEFQKLLDIFFVFFSVSPVYSNHYIGMCAK